jgi:transcriptional regulator with XRE-family HTH domain
MDIKNRLVEYLKHRGLGQTAFEEKAGLSRGQIAQKNRGFNSESLKCIAEYATDLSMEWLIRGEGGMLKSENRDSWFQSEPEGPAYENSYGDETDYRKRYYDLLEENRETGRENRILNRENRDLHKEKDSFRGMVDEVKNKIIQIQSTVIEDKERFDEIKNELVGEVSAVLDALRAG